MKKLICLIATVMLLFTACTSGSDNNGVIDDGDGIIDENIENNGQTDVGDVAEDAVDGAGDMAKDAIDGAGDMARDAMDGAGNMAKDAADGINKATEDMTGNRRK